jgi:hypothetical protein
MEVHELEQQLFHYHSVVQGRTGDMYVYCRRNKWHGLDSRQRPTGSSPGTHLSTSMSYSTLPWPIDHRGLLKDSISKKKKENSANKQRSHLKVSSDCLLPADKI